MTGLYYVDLLDVLADAGVACAVADVNAGWESRARSSGGFPAAPLAVFWHHTASSTSAANDLNYMINGSPDAPVGNMLLDRSGVVWPVAAGASNCAGKGGPSTLSRGVIPVDQGNTHGWQIEAQNNGVGEAWATAQIDAYFAASNALSAWFGNAPGDVLTHASWTSRKIDPATAAAVEGSWVPGSTNTSGTWNVDDVRAECAARASSAPAPTPPDPGPGPTPPPLPPDEDSVMTQFLLRNSATGQIVLITPGVTASGLSIDDVDAYAARFGPWLDTHPDVFADLLRKAGG